MKHSLLTSLLFLCLSSGAFARLGETKAEIEVRYGKGTPTFQRAPESEQLSYTKNGFEINVVFHDGKSVWELFKRTDKMISDADIKDLLKTVSPEGPWAYSPNDKTWHKNGRKLTARRVAGHEDWLSVRNEEILGPLEKKKGKANTSGF